MTRSAVAKDEGTTLLIVGGTPGKAYDPRRRRRPRPSLPTTPATTTTAVERQRVVVEKRPDSVLAIYNAACFEAKAGRADEALRAPPSERSTWTRAVKEYIENDEDLDSLREDPRFVVLAK